MSMTPVSKKLGDVAKYFILRSNLEKKPITNKKLQKLVYYSQVWSLALNNEKLFSERIEAWVHGPAVPSLYRRYKGFEFNPIELDVEEGELSFTTKEKTLLDNIWKIYGKHNADYLEALSHSELPWQEARKDLDQATASDSIISLATAKKYYAGLLKKNNG